METILKKPIKKVSEEHREQIDVTSDCQRVIERLIKELEEKQVIQTTILQRSIQGKLKL